MSTPITSTEPVSLLRMLPHRTGIVIATILVIIAATVFPRNAEANSRRNIGIGAGVVGGMILLDRLSKSGRKAGGSYKKKTVRKHTPAKPKKSYSSKSYKGSKSTAKAPSSHKTKTVPADNDVEEIRAPDLAATPGERTPVASPGTAALVGGAPAAAVAAQPSLEAREPSPSATVISSPDEIKSAQEHLKFMGYDIPAVSGTIDTKTKVAILLFQDTIGAQATGQLTVEQLQLLYRKATEQVGAAGPIAK